MPVRDLIDAGDPVVQGVFHLRDGLGITRPHQPAELHGRGPAQKRCVDALALAGALAHVKRHHHSAERERARHVIHKRTLHEFGRAARSLFGGNARRGLDNRVDAPALAQRATLSVGGDREIDEPGVFAHQGVRAQSEFLDRSGAIALHEHVDL